MERIEDLLSRISELTKRKASPQGDSMNLAGERHREKSRARETDRASEANIGTVLPSSDKDYADIAIVTALASPELEQVVNALNVNWSKDGREGIVFDVGVCIENDLPARLAIASQNSMGMVPAAILASKTIRAWRPKIIAMCGICAGVRGKVNLGDIIVGKQIFDYGSGRISNGCLEPDYEPISIDEAILNSVGALATDRNVTKRIREEWPLSETGKPDTDLHVHVGAFASGAAVVADEDVVKGIREHKRSLLGIDMEAYGVARAANATLSPPTPCIVVKGVQDFADKEKSDKFREYAAFASARFLVEVLKTCWKGFLGSMSAR